MGFFKRFFSLGTTQGMLDDARDELNQRLRQLARTDRQVVTALERGMPREDEDKALEAITIIEEQRIIINEKLAELDIIEGRVEAQKARQALSAAALG